MACLTVSSAFPIVKVPKKAPKKAPKVTPSQFTETLGGRLAMQGLVWGGAARTMLNEHFVDQLSDPHAVMTTAAVAGLVGVASAVTAEKAGEETYYSWTPEAETLNGRLAMLGITAALLFNI